MKKESPLNDEYKENIKEATELIYPVLEKYGFVSSKLSVKKQKNIKEGLNKILINRKVTPVKARMIKYMKAPLMKEKYMKVTDRKVTAVKRPMTKSAIMNEVSANTGLTKKQVASVFDELGIIIERHIKKRSPRQFTLPGLLKIEVNRKPKTKARKGINPFTGEPMMFKAKPARNVVKIRPLKQVKDMVD